MASNTPTPSHKNSSMFHTDALQALAHVQQLYREQIDHLRAAMQRFVAGETPAAPIHAYYPFVRIKTTTVAQADTKLTYGFVEGPGTYEATLTRPDLFASYFGEQLRLLILHHQVPIEVGLSDKPIPIHFSFADNDHIEGSLSPERRMLMRDVFDLPDLESMDDGIANGTWRAAAGEALPLSLFTAPRVDYSLHRLRHYTGTAPDWYQNFVLFTNYQFYIDEFAAWARQLMKNGGEGYTAFVEPGNIITPAGSDRPDTDAVLGRLPQMPAYHLKKKGHAGITLVNIGVGPSNAKTITDHIAVLRPHAWLMVGHCAGLRNSQRLGDYVLAHAYVREDHVLDDDLPVWVPIPALAEVQLALEGAVAEVTGYEGFELKRIMRTGTVATIDNRNWELRDQAGPVKRLSQSRAIALDMESATIAANGFRFRVPYGTLLCVSDKPLHGELKLPGMATEFYRTQVAQHLQIGIRAVQKLAAMPTETLHSRKLRSFYETAFQ